METGLTVSSLEPMRYFYRDILGMTPAGHISVVGFHIEAYRFGNSMLKLNLPPLDIRPEPHEPDFKWGLVTIRVADVEAIMRECEKEEVKDFYPLHTSEFENGGKAKAAVVVDPMGNLVEVIQVLEGKLDWD